MDTNQQIGITETGEISFHLEAFNNLRRANIIITKNLTKDLIEKLIEHKDKCILHLTCTGMGCSKLEPFVPNTDQLFSNFEQLINLGFPINQVVLRVDPIIPTPKGVKTALSVIKLFINNFGITRIRWSSLDMYEHVKERFKDKNIPTPYDTFHANIVQRNALYSILEGICYVADIKLEACGEEGYETPCISQTDLDILGITDIELNGSADQRKTCSCPANKVQLISGGFKNNTKCPNNCLYCYIK